MANEIYHRSNWGNAVNDIAWGDVYEKFDATNEMFVRSDNYENSNETDKLMAAINPKPSILLTPTAYDNGSLHSVKPVKTFGSELITNGDFATDSDWIVTQSGNDTIIIENGYALFNCPDNSNIFISQAGLLTIGKTYIASVDLLSINSGSLQFAQGGGGTITGSPSINTVGTHTFTFVAATATFAVKRKLGAPNLLNAKIDNVSVKEVKEADFDFTRGTTATRVNEQGLVADVTDTNLPRIDYTGGTGKILLEPQTTNLLTYSEDFSQWSAGSTITLQSGFSAPDGTNNAYKLTKTGTAQPYLIFNASLTTSSTRSIFAKTVSGTGTVNLLSHNSNTNNLFTLTENWQRFDVTSSNSTGVANFYAVDFRGSSSLSEIIVFGANATNDQAFATSYIPTSGSTSTRNAETANNAGSSDLISSTEGVLYAEISSLSNDGTSRRISLSDGSIDNRVSLEIDETANKIKAFISSGGVSQILEHTATDLTQNNKIAIKYKLNDMSIWLNGSEVVTDTSGNMPVGLDRLNFDGGNLSNDFYGKTKCVAVYKEALTDAQLTALTT